MDDPVQAQLIAARRNQILDAAAQVFAEKGFHPTTIKDIARAAGVADGTIYNYFKNKPALLLGIFERMREAMQPEAVFAELDEVDLKTFMRVFLAQPLIALKQDNFELFRVIVSEMMVNAEVRTLYHEQILAPTIALAEHILQPWLESGEIKSTNMEVTVRAISGMVTGVIIETIMGDPVLEAHWDDLPDLLTELILHGVEAK